MCGEAGDAPQINPRTGKSAGTWELADGWKESLADLGEYHDRMARLYPLVGQKAVGYQTLDPNIPVPAFEGVVVGKGLDDELTGQMFAAVRTSAGTELLHPVASRGRGVPASGRDGPGGISDRAVAEAGRPNHCAVRPRKWRHLRSEAPPTGFGNSALGRYATAANRPPPTGLQRISGGSNGSPDTDSRTRLPDGQVAGSAQFDRRARGARADPPAQLASR